MNTQKKRIIFGMIFIVITFSLLYFASATPSVTRTITGTPDKSKGDTFEIVYSAENMEEGYACIISEIINGECKNLEMDPEKTLTNNADFKGKTANEVMLLLTEKTKTENVNIELFGDKGCTITGSFTCNKGTPTTFTWTSFAQGINIVKKQTETDPANICQKNGDEVCKQSCDTNNLETPGTSQQNSWCLEHFPGQGGELEKGGNALRPALDKCCIAGAKCASNKGYDLVDSKDESDKCLEDSLLQTSDAVEGQVCCKIKEKVRESVKEPDTIGRLNSCFGKYWLWGKEGEDANLGKAAGILNSANTQLLTGEQKCANIVEHFKTIYDGKNELKELTPTQKLDRIDTIKKEISECRTALAPKKADEAIDADKKKLRDSLKTVQDTLEKSRGMTAMTGSEIGANLISCIIGMSYASKLAFGNYESGLALGFMGGFAGAMLGGETGVFNKDVTAILGNAAGGFLASLTPPYDLTSEMGSCAPESPIKGSELCSTCNEDPYRLCTRERCNILGSCIPVPTAKGDQVVCIAGKCDNIGMPIFTKGNLEWYVDTDLNGSQPLTIQGGNIRTRINSKPVDPGIKANWIPFNTKTIMINLTTDKPAKCRYILDKTNATFAEMTDFEENEFPALAGGVAGSQAVHIMLSGIIARGIDHNIFIKCQNSCGVEPSPNYDQNVITFKLEQKPDQLPPNIIYVDPASGSIIRSDLKTVETSFWLDEKGDCRFADQSTNYSAFNYTKMIPFGNYNNPNSSVITGSCDNTKPCLDRNDTCARCTLKLDLSKGYELTNYTSTEFNTTKTYHLILRCNDLRNNVMTADDALDYILMTAPGYDINITEPSEDGMFTYDTTPEIQITSDPRETQCKYKIYNTTSGPNQPSPKWEDMTFLDDSLGLVHTGIVNETLAASPEPGHAYTIAALCRDKFNMEARDWRKFLIIKDVASPILIRTYHDSITGDFLVLETDEPSVCAYSFDSCNFNFTQGILMTGNEVIHGTYWKDKTFFIKCVDAWGNYPSATGGTIDPAFNYCTATLKPFEIPSLFL